MVISLSHCVISVKYGPWASSSGCIRLNGTLDLSTRSENLQNTIQILFCMPMNGHVNFQNSWREL